MLAYVEVYISVSGVMPERAQRRISYPLGRSQDLIMLLVGVSSRILHMPSSTALKVGKEGSFHGDCRSLFEEGLLFPK